MRSIASSALLLVTALATLGAGVGCGGGTRACKQGTLFVTVTFPGTTSAADQLRVAVRIDDGAERATVIPRTSGASQDTIEVNFPSGYPAGKSVDVEIQALMNGVSLARSTGGVTSLPDGCRALTIGLSEGNPPGSGGVGGTGGGAAGRGGNGGSTGGGTAGRGGAGGSTGGTATNCVMGLSNPPATPVFTDFSDAIADSQNAGEIRFGTLNTLHGGSARYASTTNLGTLTLSGGALTFSATVEAPTASMMYPYNGFVLFTDGPACVNAGAYQGVQFTLSNVTGACMITFKFSDSAHSISSADPPRGTCSGSCFAGSFPAVAGTTQIPFASVPTYAGSPPTASDPTKLTDVQFQLQPVGTTACTGSITIDDIKFYGSGGTTGTAGASGTAGRGGTTGTGGAGNTVGTAGSGGRGGTTGTGGVGGTTGTGGSGNTVGTAGSGGRGGTGGTSATCPATFDVSADGFVRSPALSGGGCFRGYAFAGGDPSSTITPSSFSACGTPCMLKMMGTVGPAVSPSFAGVGFLGVNLAQELASSSIGLVTPTGTGVTIGFSATTGSLPLRVQLSNGSTFWCYTITGTSPINVPYAMFNTACWDPVTGTAYGKQPISTLQLVVPGGPTATAGVSVTLTSLKEY